MSNKLNALVERLKAHQRDLILRWPSTMECRL